MPEPSLSPPTPTVAARDIIFGILHGILAAFLMGALEATVFFPPMTIILALCTVPFFIAPACFLLLPLLHRWMNRKATQNLADYLMDGAVLFSLLWFPLAILISNSSIAVRYWAFTVPCALAAVYNFHRYIFARKRTSQ